MKRCNDCEEPCHKETESATELTVTLQIPCPHCFVDTLVQHAHFNELLICPTCWWKYEKQKAFLGEFIRVTKGEALKKYKYRRSLAP